MAAASFKIVGSKILERRLRKLDKKVRTKVAKNAMKKAAKPIVTTAKRILNTHADTGLLARSIWATIRQYKHKYGGTSVAVIGPRTDFKAPKLYAGLSEAKATRKPSKYAHLVEFGTKPHRHMGMYSPKGYIKFPNDMHPGAPARPFMRPAFHQNKWRGVSIMSSELRKALTKIS